MGEVAHVALKECGHLITNNHLLLEEVKHQDKLGVFTGCQLRVNPDRKPTQWLPL